MSALWVNSGEGECNDSVGSAPLTCATHVHVAGNKRHMVESALHALEDPMTVLEPSSLRFSEKQQDDILWTTDISVRAPTQNTHRCGFWVKVLGSVASHRPDTPRHYGRECVVEAIVQQKAGVGEFFVAQG